MTSNTAQASASKPNMTVQRSIAWYLRQLSRVLRVLSDDELERLAPLLSERRFAAREMLFSTGEPAERVYLMLKGRVKVYQISDNGKEIILDVVGRGGVIGDMAIVENGERTATAQALEETVALAISWEDFAHVIQRSPQLGFAMAELMAHRLVNMQRNFANMVTKPVGARLADALLERNAGGIIHLGLTHQELGQTIGTSRETVTALLGRFAHLGAIEPVPGGYRVLNETLLAAVAAGDVQVSPRHPGVKSPQPDVLPS
jgi:CRP/FNR family transcriptional regulator